MIKNVLFLLPKKDFLMALFFIPFLSCTGYEEPDYKVLEKESMIEIREYPSLILAEVRGDGEEKATRDEGFRALFQYITGANEQSQEIKMTAPVFQSQLGDNQWSMSFVIPKKWEWKKIPQPKNKNILLRKLESQEMAVISFKGRGRDKNFSKHQKILENYLKEKNKNYNEEKAIYAFYNPPWTPWFMKRHEVLFVIETTEPKNLEPDNSNPEN